MRDKCPKTLLQGSTKKTSTKALRGSPCDAGFQQQHPLPELLWGGPPVCLLLLIRVLLLVSLFVSGT